jgi:hypothetical protein
MPIVTEPEPPATNDTITANDTNNNGGSSEGGDAFQPGDNTT